MLDRLNDITIKKPQQFFGIPYLNNLARLDTGCCLLGSMKLGGYLIPIITIHVPEFRLGYFGIKNKPFEIDHRFRYLSYFRDELIQICVQLKKEREIVLNLDPLSAVVREFLKMAMKMEMFGFTFLCKKKNLFICTSPCPMTLKRNGYQGIFGGPKNLKRTTALFSC